MDYQAKRNLVKIRREVSYTDDKGQQGIDLIKCLRLFYRVVEKMNIESPYYGSVNTLIALKPYRRKRRHKKKRYKLRHGKRYLIQGGTE